MGYLWEESAVNTVAYVLASKQKKRMDVYLHFHALSDSKLAETLQLASDLSEPENFTLAFLNESNRHFAFVVIVKKATEICATVFDRTDHIRWMLSYQLSKERWLTFSGSISKTKMSCINVFETDLIRDLIVARVRLL
jgi:hypothetical protein